MEGLPSTQHSRKVILDDRWDRCQEDMPTFVAQVWETGKEREQTPEGGTHVDDTEDMLDLVDVERHRKAVWLRQGFNKWSGLYTWGHTFTFQMTNQDFRDKQ